MRSERGFTLTELIIGIGLISVLAAVAVPVILESTRRSAVWTGSEAIGAEIRGARLKAISRNTTFRVRFACPTALAFRVLVVTGTAAIDNAADRCSTSQPLDSGIIAVPEGVSFGTVPTLEVNGRGIFTAEGAAIPLTITVTNADATRSFTVSATGQITFSD